MSNMTNTQKIEAQAVPVVVSVPIVIDVDHEVWADTYGMPQASQSSAAARSLREDITLHLAAIVREAATEAVARLAAGAEVRQ